MIPVRKNATMSFPSVWNLWSHATESVHWYDCSIHSHAIALAAIYLLWRLPWRWTYEDKLLKPPRKPEPSKRTKQDILEAPPSLLVSVASDSDGEDGDLVDSDDAALANACPDATPSERQRFFNARQRNMPAATKTLTHYLNWTMKHEDVAREHCSMIKSTGDRDLDIWTEVCAVAMKASGEVGDVVALPRVIRTHHIDGKSAGDLQGNRIFHIIPAQLDDTLANASTYALATALFIDKQLDRHGTERISVCMDVRAGKGWPNIHAMRQVPFMQQTTTLLLSLFPERLHKCLLYPVPSSFLWIWKMVSKVLEPVTRDKVCLLSGANKIAAIPPFEQMYEHMEKDVAHLLENSRVAAFKD
jgi:hypothetical protein